jgi:hypothetical protein
LRHTWPRIHAYSHRDHHCPHIHPPCNRHHTAHLLPNALVPLSCLLLGNRHAVIRTACWFNRRACFLPLLEAHIAVWDCIYTGKLDDLRALHSCLLSWSTEPTKALNIPDILHDNEVLKSHTQKNLLTPSPTTEDTQKNLPTPSPTIPRFFWVSSGYGSSHTRMVSGGSSGYGSS